MSTANPKQQSDFAQAALALDADFEQLERLSGELDRLAIDSDSGLERAKALLLRFGECGQRIGDEMQALARSLEEARTRAEASANRVAERAAAIQKRQIEADRLLQRFQALSEMVRKVTEAAGALQQSLKKDASDEERRALIRNLPELDSKLGVLIDEAFKIRQDAQEANLKTLHRNADSLGQTLQSVRRKLGSLVKA
jgi:hypothetical protein